MRRLSSLILFLGSTLSGSALASGGVIVHFVNFYDMLLHSMGLNEEQIKQWVAVPGAIVTIICLILLGLAFNRHAEAVLAAGGSPRGNLSFGNAVEFCIEFVENMARDIIGAENYGKHMVLLCSLFFFILVSNLWGLVPGIHPATLSLNTNLAMGLSVFLYYNWCGIKEHGSHYINQFLGPIAWMIPLMLVIELIAHCARPMSLSLRLYGNIFGDHLVLSVFTGLTWVVGPALFMFFGLLVALLQSFVFTLLSSIYIALSISHDH